MDVLLESLVQIANGLWGIVRFIATEATPWLGLVAWIAFWLFAVNWRRLNTVLWQGGFIGVALIALVMVLVWGSIAPPESGRHFLLGLSVSNYVGKFVYVTALFCIMFLCGSVQLSGVLGNDGWQLAEAESQPDSHGHDSHGHDAHAGHHDSHAGHH